MGLVFGRVIIDDILFDRQRNPEVARLSSGMTLVHDPALDANYPERYTSVVELLLRDGRTVSRRVEFARGTRENPLTADEVRAKYFRLTGPVVPHARAEALMAAVDRLDRARDLSPLARSCARRLERGRAGASAYQQGSCSRRAAHVAGAPHAPSAPGQRTIDHTSALAPWLWST